MHSPTFLDKFKNGEIPKENSTLQAYKEMARSHITEEEIKDTREALIAVKYLARREYSIPSLMEIQDHIIYLRYLNPICRCGKKDNLNLCEVCHLDGVCSNESCKKINAEHCGEYYKEYSPRIGCNSDGRHKPMDPKVVSQICVLLKEKYKNT